MVPFCKMNGLGNKIIVADMRAEHESFTSQAAIALAKTKDMHFDQIMVLYQPFTKNVDYSIEIFNSDGSKANACGNGTRCVVAFLFQQGLGSQFVFDIMGKSIDARYENDNLISVDMGEPGLEWQNIPTLFAVADTNNVAIGEGPLQDASLVSMGNPHAVYFVGRDIKTIPLEIYGPKLEHNSFFPKRCNISIAYVENDRKITLRTWERGAGLTLACGTAACASVVAATRRGLTKKEVEVSLPGGKLQIKWQNNNHIIMSGPVEVEFSGDVNPITGTYKISQHIRNTA